MTETTEVQEGWGTPPTSRKFHYFREGRSLCGNWGFAFHLPLEPDNGKPSKDDCVACRRALEKEAA